jgi:hypothetical protein
MNNIFKKIFWKDERQRKAIPPVLDCISINQATPEFCPQTLRELHSLNMILRMDFWLDSEQAQKEKSKELFREQFVKQLQYEFYGQIEYLVHELTLHVMREEYEDCIKVLQLLRTAIKGE